MGLYVGCACMLAGRAFRVACTLNQARTCTRCAPGTQRRRLHARSAMSRQDIHSASLVHTRRLCRYRCGKGNIQCSYELAQLSMGKGNARSNDTRRHALHPIWDLAQAMQTMHARSGGHTARGCRGQQARAVRSLRRRSKQLGHAVFRCAVACDCPRNLVIQPTDSLWVP